MLHIRKRGVLYFHVLSVLDSIKILAQLSSLLFIFYFWLSQFFVNIWVLFFINLKNSLKGVLQLFCLSFSTFSFNCGCCTGLNTIIKFPHALANLFQIFHLQNCSSYHHALLFVLTHFSLPCFLLGLVCGGHKFPSLGGKC